MSKRVCVCMCLGCVCVFGVCVCVCVCTTDAPSQKAWVDRSGRGHPDDS